MLCTTWTLTKRLEKKLDGNYTRMLRAILNKSWRQHPTKHQLYDHLPPITKTIQVRRTRHAGHCWRSRDELISDVLLWTQEYGWAKAGRPARTYIQQLCEDTGCSLEDLLEAMNDREKWRERVRVIRADGMTWWWWWWWCIWDSCIFSTWVSCPLDAITNLVSRMLQFTLDLTNHIASLMKDTPSTRFYFVNSSIPFMYSKILCILVSLLLLLMLYILVSMLL